MSESAGDDFVTVPAAAKLLGFQFRTVYYLIDRGELPAEVTVFQGRGAGGRSGSGAKTSRITSREARLKPGELRYLRWPWHRYSEGPRPQR